MGAGSLEVRNGTDAAHTTSGNGHLRGLRGDVLEMLEAQSSELCCAAGEFFIHEGDSGERLYVLLEGRVEILKRAGERLRRLRCLGPGDCFGEMALMDMSRRSASVRA